MIRFSADEVVQGGRDISESRVLAKLFAEWGFDALHVSSGAYGDHNKGIVSPMYVSHAWTGRFCCGDQTDRRHPGLYGQPHQ